MGRSVVLGCNVMLPLAILEFLNRSLRNQFICGIRDSATRKMLLSDEVASKETLEVQNDAKPGDQCIRWVMVGVY